MAAKKKRSWVGKCNIVLEKVKKIDYVNIVLCKMHVCQDLFVYIKELKLHVVHTSNITLKLTPQPLELKHQFFCPLSHFLGTVI